MSNSNPADVISFVDEAGDRGYVRKLTEADDKQVGLFCAIPVETTQVETVRNLVQPLYKQFCDAAPPGAKLHITDAFKKGNEAWGQVAREVRSRLFRLSKDIPLSVVYVARRARIARERHEVEQALQAEAEKLVAARGAKTYSIVGGNRPNPDTIDEQLMLDLTLTLDEFMIERGYRLTDLKFDEISSSIATEFRMQMSRPKQLTAPQTKLVEAFNHTTRQKEGRLITTQIHRDPELNVSKVGSLTTYRFPGVPEWRQG